MTREAHLPIALRHARCVEAGTVRIHAQPDIRMAARAVTLLVTAGARLHFLSRRLTVLREPERLTIVIGDVTCAACRHPLATMTLAAERLGRVA